MSVSLEKPVLDATITILEADAGDVGALEKVANFNQLFSDIFVDHRRRVEAGEDVDEDLELIWVAIANLTIFLSRLVGVDKRVAELESKQNDLAVGITQSIGTVGARVARLEHWRGAWPSTLRPSGRRVGE